MDGSYKLMELRVSWKVPHASAADARRDDAHRDHEQDFLAFVHAVVAGLASSAAVSWQSTSGKKEANRDVTFASDRPIAQADWAKAVGDAASSCGVSSDQADWSFE